MTKLSTIYISPGGYAAQPSICIEQLAAEVSNGSPMVAAAVAAGIRRFALQAEYWMRDSLAYERAKAPGADHRDLKSLAHGVVLGELLTCSVTPAALNSSPADDDLFDQLQTEAHRWVAPSADELRDELRSQRDAEQDAPTPRVA